MIRSPRLRLSENRSRFWSHDAGLCLLNQCECAYVLDHAFAILQSTFNAFKFIRQQNSWWHHFNYILISSSIIFIESYMWLRLIAILLIKFIYLFFLGWKLWQAYKTEKLNWHIHSKRNCNPPFLVVVWAGNIIGWPTFYVSIIIENFIRMNIFFWLKLLLLRKDVGRYPKNKMWSNQPYFSCLDDLE